MKGPSGTAQVIDAVARLSGVLYAQPVALDLLQSLERHVTNEVCLTQTDLILGNEQLGSCRQDASSYSRGSFPVKMS